MVCNVGTVCYGREKYIAEPGRLSFNGEYYAQICRYKRHEIRQHTKTTMFNICCCLACTSFN